MNNPRQPEHYGERRLKSLLDKFNDDSYFYWFSIDYLPKVSDIDLLLVHREAGAFSLEIKAVPISEIEAVSHTTIEIRGRGKKDNPNIQAYKAMTSLWNYFSDNGHSFPFYMVASSVFPLIERREWKSAFRHSPAIQKLADSMIMKDDLFSSKILELRLSDIYYNPPVRKGSRQDFSFNRNGINLLNNLLSDTVVKPKPPSISSFKDIAKKQSRYLQKRYTLNSSMRLAFEGIPGSGKTYCLLTLADMFGSEGYNVVFLCYNKALASQLRINIDTLAHENNDPELVQFVAVYDIFEHASLMAKALGIDILTTDDFEKWLDLIREEIESTETTVVGFPEVLLVDEVQDFAPSHIRWVEYWASKANKVAVARGIGQELYSNQSNNLRWLKEFDIEILNTNYRNPGKLFLMSYLVGGTRLDQRELPQFIKSVRSDLKSKKLKVQRKTEMGLSLIQVDDSTDEVLINDYKSVIAFELSDLLEGGQDPYQLLILVRGRKSKRLIQEALKQLKEESNIDSLDMLNSESRRQAPTADKIRICTFESARGLEANTVIIAGFELLQLGEMRDANLGLVTLSRAIEKCIILERVCTGPSLSSSLENFIVNTPFLTQSSRRVFMPHFGTQMASCH